MDCETFGVGNKFEPVELDIEIWRDASEVFDEERTKLEKAIQKAKKKKKSSTVVKSVHVIRQFTYSLKDRQFIKGSAGTISNLYFEFAALTNEDVSNDYIVVQTDDEDLDALNPSMMRNGVTKSSFSYDVDHHREMVLRHGIAMPRSAHQQENEVFNLIGCSNSQVQKHCYIFRRSKDLETNERRVLEVLPELKKLEQKKGVPKRVKYAGLLFSGVTVVHLPLTGVVVEEIESKENQQYDFTDGPGLISRKLAMHVKTQLGHQGPNCPSVFQIRYCGTVKMLDGSTKRYVCKGVLLVDPTEDECYKIQVRKSMLKISSSQKACNVLKNVLGICEYSRPSPGRLGQQLICLLSGIVERDDFLKLQAEHLDCAKRALQDPFSMAWFLALDRRQQPWADFHELLVKKPWLSSLEKDQEKSLRLYQKCVKSAEKNSSVPEKGKAQLPLAACRNLFGAVFPELLHNDINEGECVVLLENGPLSRRSVRSCKNEQDYFVIVSRSPSYHPGDIRLLRVVSLPEGHPVNRLRNCILFSTRGKRPDPDKMGGGDLDGDKYLVIWHPILLKYASKLKNLQPATYDDCTPRNQDKNMSEGDWIHYAAMTDNAMLGQVENTFYKLAKEFGINSEQVKTLNALFSSLVDRNPTSLDAFKQLKGCLPWGESSEKCVWEEMVARQLEARSMEKRGDDESNYQAFQCSIPDINLAKKFEIDYGFHFLESLRQKEVRLAIDSLRAKSTESGTGEANAESSRKVPGVSSKIEDFSRVPLKISGKEDSELRELESRANRLFQGPLYEIERMRSPAEETVRDQQSRKEAINRDFDAKVGELEQRINDLETEHSEASSRFRDWLDERHRHYESIKEQKKLMPLAVLRSFDTELSQKQLQIRDTRHELAKATENMNSYPWYVWETFSVARRDAADRQREVQRKIITMEQEIHKLEARKNVVNENLRSLLVDLDNSQITETASREQRYNEEIRSIQRMREQFEDENKSLHQALGDHLSGAKKQCTEDHVVQLKSRIAESQGKRGFSDTKGPETEDDKSLTWLRKRLNETQTMLKSMFSPLTLKEAESRLAELEEQEESRRIGLDHILLKVSQARRKWPETLKSKVRNSADRDREWRFVIEGLNRVFAIEENRLLGFPRKGERKGPLRVYEKRAQLKRLMTSSQAVVVTAGTGCGKSTQIPQYIADDLYLHRQTVKGDETDQPVRICCTQPRRVAAQKVASRVAEEYLTDIGELVGYKVGSRGRSRAECEKITKNTAIEFVTEGLLLFSLVKSPNFLERYDCVIIDEMHERNTEQDLCLSLLRDYLKTSTRPSFKVVVMSASINAEKFRHYLGGCPAMHCPGKQHKVEEVYSPPPGAIPEDTSGVTHAVNVLFEEVVNDAEVGDVLIFLSGAKAIDECVGKIRKRASETENLVSAYPLYAKLDQGSISEATNPDHRLLGLNGKKVGDRKVRKVICTTNIAETSLTIDRVRFVIDSGKAKKNRYNHTLRCSVLEEAWVSHASTIQRKGRGGRVDTGKCFYLYSETFHKEKMEKYDKPNILEEPVDQLILLSLRVCGRSVEQMGLLECPDEADVTSAKNRLFDLEFLKEDDEGQVHLSEDGKLASYLSSIRPESVRMILNACKRYPECVKEAIMLANLLSSDDSIFDKKTDVHEEDRKCDVHGDHLLGLHHLKWFESAYSCSNSKGKKMLKKKCAERGLSYRVMEEIQRSVDTCHSELKQRKLFPSLTPMTEQGMASIDQRLLRVLLSGYFHHVVDCFETDFISRSGCSLLSQQGVTVYLDRDSCLNEFFAKGMGMNECIQDDDQVTTSACDDGIEFVREEVTPSFLVYGNLFGAKTGQIFMLDASVIEADCILEEAPKRWLDRVSFQSRRTTLCRITMKHLGAQVLADCNKFSKGETTFWEEVQQETGAKQVLASQQHSLIRITGTQRIVDNTRAKLAEALERAMKERRRKDKAHSGAFIMGEGMRILEQHPEIGKRKPLSQLFRSRGTNEENIYQIGNVAEIFSHRQTSSIVANPIRHWTKAELKKVLENGSTRNVKWNENKFGFRLQVDPEAKQVIELLWANGALCAEGVARRSFREKNANMVAAAIGDEAIRNSPFWQRFCREVCDKPFSFLKSRDAFVFGPSGKKDAPKFRNLVSNLAQAMEFYKIEQELPFLRYQVRRLAAILSELKKRCPTVLFYLVEVTSVNDETLKNTELISDYEWLMDIAKAHRINGIRVAFASFQNKDKKPSRQLVKEHLCVEALIDNKTALKPAPSDENKNWTEQKRCVMCRRDVLVQSWRQSKSSIMANHLEGWNLTLCGCTYCRECFRISVTTTLSDETSRCARCLNCKRIVLARDCRNIINPYEKNKEENQKEQKGNQKKEWNQLCRVAEAAYCQSHLSCLSQGMKSGRSMERNKGAATCPDCQYTMIFPAGYKLFVCRNEKCRSKMCTRCLRVVLSKEDCKRCSASECVPYDE